MIRAIQFQNKRVGSTFLQNAINSHPDIMGIDEVFVNMAKKKGMKKSGFDPYLKSGIQRPSEYIEDVIYKKYDDKHTIFKLMYNQIGWHDGLMNYIIDNKIPMIHMMRRNLVKQIISGLTAANESHLPITITGKDLLILVKEADKMNKYWSNKLKDHIKLVLFYEDIIGETKGDKTYIAPNANAAVSSFFNVSQYLLFATTKKKNKEDMAVYLPNLDDIKNTFKGTKYEWCL